jgi:hypothetical protein
MWIDDEADWYVHGDYVLDMISGLRQAESVHVVCRGHAVSPDRVRAALAIPAPLRVHVADTAQPLAFTVDTLVLASDGIVRDVFTGHAATPQWPLHLRVITANLDNAQVLRLAVTMANYPDLVVDDALRRRVGADLDYLESVREAFPDIEELLEAARPLQKWRVGISDHV